MTNKDLSRELCEICGIKPMYRLEDINALYNEDMYNEFCEMRLNKGLLIPTGTKAIFPDFTQPENFVKLLNTNTDYITKNNKQIFCKSIWWCINSAAKRFEQTAPYEIDTFLITLILILKNEDNLYKQSEIDKIKQTIRSEEWKYE